MSRLSIRFYKDHKVQTVWDEEQNLWWFSVFHINFMISGAKSLNPKF